MSKSLYFFFLIQLSLFAIYSAGSADENSRDFFRGLISRGLGDPNWNDSIVSYVNSSNFNVQNLLTANQILLKNAQSHSSNNSLAALGQITISFVSVLDALFPIIAFSLRFDGIIRLIPSQYQSVFNILNQTFSFYSDEENLPAILKQETHLNSLIQYGNKQQFFLSGQSFEEMTESITNGAENLGIDLSQENEQSMELLLGLISGLGSGEAVTAGLLTHINSTVFNQHKILNCFNILSQNSFNFSSSNGDEEEFTENVGEISFYLMNARDIAQQYGTAEAGRQLTFVFNLFEQHTQLLGNIRIALSQQLDMRSYFKKIYTDGEIDGNYEDAGNFWAVVSYMLNNSNNRLSDSNRKQKN